MPLLLMLRCGTTPHAAELLRKSLDRHVLGPIAECLGGPDAAVRAAMVVAQCTGFAMVDEMLRPQALVGAKREELMLLLKESLASCIGRDPRDGRRGLHR